MSGHWEAGLTFTIRHAPKCQWYSILRPSPPVLAPLGGAILLSSRAERVLDTALAALKCRYAHENLTGFARGLPRVDSHALWPVKVNEE